MFKNELGYKFYLIFALTCIFYNLHFTVHGGSRTISPKSVFHMNFLCHFDQTLMNLIGSSSSVHGHVNSSRKALNYTKVDLSKKVKQLYYLLLSKVNFCDACF